MEAVKSLDGDWQALLIERDDTSSGFKGLLASEGMGVPSTCVGADAVGYD